jgi:hypothetical protein
MKKQKTEKVFRSRISIVFLGFFIVLFIRCAIPPIIIPALFFIGIAVLFMALLVGGMRYIILDDNLYLKIWKIPYWTVKIASIKSIERSYNFLSNKFCASFKGIRITYLGKLSSCSMLISPVKEQEFIEQLKRINPDIYVRVPVKKGIWRIQDWDI